MAEDLPIWIERYAECLGCDAQAASVAVAIEDLLSERERQRKALGQLRGQGAERQRIANSDDLCLLAGWHEGRCPGAAARKKGECVCLAHPQPAARQPASHPDHRYSCC
ncbi:hypothetical protein [Candidatus Laterigemmans baculatus]|uniref:hypothetical protein n=1 Tax=Candidatus Laterigemmans baculatus TaxID=2770505 RepID=UPI0013D8E62A|nr:hypothetical protein [Candidatus Laterigemmans baculatus]